MSEPFKFRYLREIVGFFVLGSLLAALASLFLVGEGRNWFVRRVDLTAVFPAERAGVIRSGLPVRLAGERIGLVTEVVLDGDDLRVRLRVAGSALAGLRADSKAVLRLPIAGLIGDLAIDLTPGRSGTVIRAGDTLPGSNEGDVLGDAEVIMKALARDIPPILSETRAALVRTNALLQQLEQNRAGEHVAALAASAARLTTQAESAQLAAHAAATAAELAALLKSINQGEGSLGKLARDPALHQRVITALDDVHASWGELAKVIASAAKVAEDASVMSAALRTRANDLPAIVDRSDRMLLNANRTLEAAQRSWLLRDGVQAGNPPPLPPAVLPPEPAAAVQPSGPVAPVAPGAPGGTGAKP